MASASSRGRAGALLHRLDGGHRGGVVRTRLAGHEGLRRGEDHPGLDGVELQGALLLLPPRLPVQLAVGGVLQHAEGRLAQVGRCRDGVHRADLEGVGRRPLLPARDPLDRGVGPAEAGEPHRPAPAGEEAELRLGQADPRLRRHRPVARGEAELEAAAEGDPVDGDDGRRLEVFDGGEDRVRLEEPAGELLLALAEVGQELGDVGPDAEDVLAAGDQEPAQALRGPQLPDRRPQLADRRRVELVDRLTGEIESQLDEAAVERKDLHRLSFVAHGLLLRAGG